jgi:hypothetical protein
VTGHFNVSFFVKACCLKFDDKKSCSILKTSLQLFINLLFFIIFLQTSYELVQPEPLTNLLQTPNELLTNFLQTSYELLTNIV